MLVMIFKKILVVAILTCSTFVVKAADQENSEIIDLAVTEKGFEPSSIDVAPGKSVTLNITRKTDATCATQIQIPSMKIKKDLPLNQMVTLKLGKLKLGKVRFGCGMSMMQAGIITVK